MALQDELVREISRRLRPKLSGAEEELLGTRDTENTEAYRYYLRGRFHWNKRTEEGFRRAIEEFEAAITADPAHARAHTGIADSWLLLADYGHTPAPDALARVRVAIDRALELDPLLGEAHASLGFLEMYAWNWTASEAAFLRALELDPRYPTAHLWYAVYLSVVGRHDEAIARAQLALKLDPLSPIINAIQSFLYMLDDEFDRAIAEAKRAL